MVIPKAKQIGNWSLLNGIGDSDAIGGIRGNRTISPVAARRLCFACMSPSHMLNACSSTGGCRSCNSKRHHSLLHFNNDQSSAAGKSTQSTSSSSSSGRFAEKSSAFSGAASTNSTVVLG